MLHDVAAIAPDRIQLAIDDTQPRSASARTARERYGIVPRLVTDTTGSGANSTAVFLGVAVTSGADEQVIPFSIAGSAPETRSRARCASPRARAVNASASWTAMPAFSAARTTRPDARVFLGHRLGAETPA